MSEQTDKDEPARDRALEVRRVLYLTLVLNLLVAAAKIAYGTWASALAIRADGFHSVTDSLNNVIALAGLWLARRPPDAEHPYGHNKFEIFAGGLIGLSLLALALDVAGDAVSRLQGDLTRLPRISAGAFAVLGGTLLVNLFVATYESRVGRRLESPILISDARHTLSDCFVTSGVIVAMILVRAGYAQMDLLAAAVVAVFIAWAGVGVVRHNARYLTDTALIDPERVRRIILEVPGVAGTHKVRSRGTPGAIYMDLHIQIAPHLNVVEAHKITHWVIDAVRKQIAGVADVTVHTEPAHPHQRYNPLPESEVDVREPPG